MNQSMASEAEFAHMRPVDVLPSGHHHHSYSRPFNMYRGAYPGHPYYAAFSSHSETDFSRPTTATDSRPTTAESTVTAGTGSYDGSSFYGHYPNPTPTPYTQSQLQYQRPISHMRPPENVDHRLPGSTSEEDENKSSPEHYSTMSHPHYAEQTRTYGHSTMPGPNRGDPSASTYPREYDYDPRRYDYPPPQRRYTADPSSASAGPSSHSDIEPSQSVPISTSRPSMHRSQLDGGGYPTYPPDPNSVAANYYSSQTSLPHQSQQIPPRPYHPGHMQHRENVTHPSHAHAHDHGYPHPSSQSQFRETVPVAYTPQHSHSHSQYHPYASSQTVPPTVSSSGIPPTSTAPYNQTGQAYVPIVYTDAASTKLSDRVRRRCFNCCTTDTSTWRRSNLHAGKVLCNKCGLFERTHSRSRPDQFPHRRSSAVVHDSISASSIIPSAPAPPTGTSPTSPKIAPVTVATSYPQSDAKAKAANEISSQNRLVNRSPDASATTVTPQEHPALRSSRHPGPGPTPTPTTPAESTGGDSFDKRASPTPPASALPSASASASASAPAPATVSADSPPFAGGPIRRKGRQRGHSAATKRQALDPL